MIAGKKKLNRNLSCGLFQGAAFSRLHRFLNSIFMLTRRQSLQSAIAPLIVPSSVLGQRAGAVAPSDKVVVAGIGIGARGAHVLSKFLPLARAKFIAVCDVRNERREAIKSTVDKQYGNRDCQTYDDQYELLARTDIDAVLIATGDRWHTPLSIIAAQHGKDVYCEKPCSMTIEESWALADAFRRYNRLYQAGCQRRNGANFMLCKELLKFGALGKLKALYANTGPSVNWPPLPSRDWLPAETLPPKQVLDWERWLGPAPGAPTTPLMSAVAGAISMTFMAAAFSNGAPTPSTSAIGPRASITPNPSPTNRSAATPAPTRCIANTKTASSSSCATTAGKAP